MTNHLDKEKNERIINVLSLALSLAFVITLFFSFFCGFSNFNLLKKINSLNETNSILKSVLSSDILSGKVYLIEQQAEDYYNEATIAYENQNYIGAESNCRLARKYYSRASNGYLDIIPNLKEPKGVKLLELEQKKYELASEIDLNMYEACEFLESASRDYNNYFSDSSSSYSFFESAGKEIDGMNEKIDSHDSNVREYNKIVSEIGEEINKLK